MYQEFFNLETLPFENNADPRFFFSSEEHREALAAIEYTIRTHKGFVLVTGDVGAGKTTISRTMLQRCADEFRIIPVLHGHRTGEQLFRQILRAIEVPYQNDDDRGLLIDRIAQYVNEQADQLAPIVLLVDEAHTLSDQALEELRLLTNVDNSGKNRIQVVLVAQPELRHRLQASSLRALRQRLAMVKHVRALNMQETAAYIQHRLTIASRDKDNLSIKFNGTVIETIYAATGGIPRLINFTCDNCLLLAYAKQSLEITNAMVRRVVEDMTPSLNPHSDLDDQTDSPKLALTGNM